MIAKVIHKIVHDAFRVEMNGELIRKKNLINEETEKKNYLLLSKKISVKKYCEQMQKPGGQIAQNKGVTLLRNGYVNLGEITNKA